MKMVMLMYLEDDQKCVDRLIKELEIETFSQLPVVGHRPTSASGWYGDAAPYQSMIIMTVVPNEQATSIMRAVAACRGVEDPRHPIRAVLLDVEDTTCCESAQTSTE